MNDTTILETVREAEGATTAELADRLGRHPEAIGKRLAALESAGRIERTDGKWRLARDPRLGSSVERMRDRLGRERR
ncbi:MAG: MarR family transcriptional regulator [Halalkalicoccus sp.]